MAINIFANETIYGGWKQVGNNAALKECMPEEMYNAMDEIAEVTESEKGYGKSVCFFLNNGAQRVYKSLSTTSDLAVGAKVKKSELYVTTLAKQGENNIYRITEKA